VQIAKVQTLLVSEKAIVIHHVEVIARHRAFCIPIGRKAGARKLLLFSEDTVLAMPPCKFRRITGLKMSCLSNLRYLLASSLVGSAINCDRRVSNDADLAAASV